MAFEHRNAIIMAAGTSSRFVPLSLEIPKGLLEVKGEILIERQISQLREAGINDITVVTGYMAERFEYLKDQFGVETVINEDFYRYNNTSSIIRVLDRLDNTFICSADNYFLSNVFTETSECSYYSALYSDGPTDEYCINTDEKGNIISVSVGGHDSWYMIGPAYFNSEFSNAFKGILESAYSLEETKQGYWEDVYIKYIDKLPRLQIRKYSNHEIEEFDSIDELRTFDSSYVENTRSSIVGFISNILHCKESDLSGFKKIPGHDIASEFSFTKGGERYFFDCQTKKLEKK